MWHHLLNEERQRQGLKPKQFEPPLIHPPPPREKRDKSKVINQAACFLLPTVSLLVLGNEFYVRPCLYKF
jgi:hypothetical protein